MLLIMGVSKFCFVPTACINFLNCASNGVLENSAARFTPDSNCARVNSLLSSPQVTFAFSAERFFTLSVKRFRSWLNGKNGAMLRVPLDDLLSPSKQNG